MIGVGISHAQIPFLLLHAATDKSSDFWMLPLQQIWQFTVMCLSNSQTIDSQTLGAATKFNTTAKQDVWVSLNLDQQRRSKELLVMHINLSWWQNWLSASGTTASNERQLTWMSKLFMHHMQTSTQEKQFLTSSLFWQHFETQTNFKR